jgi:hypothetical protein
VSNTSIAPLVGHTITTITGATPGSEEIIFVRVDGVKVRFYHDQECCENVEVEEVIGDISDLIATHIVLAEERSSSHESDLGDSSTWTFYVFRTLKGTVTIRWLGESNGYYSETVNIEVAGQPLWEWTEAQESKAKAAAKSPLCSACDGVGLVGEGFLICGSCGGSGKRDGN